MLNTNREKKNEKKKASFPTAVVVWICCRLQTSSNRTLFLLHAPESRWDKRQPRCTDTVLLNYCIESNAGDWMANEVLGLRRTMPPPPYATCGAAAGL